MSPRRGPQLPYRLVGAVIPAGGKWLVASAKVAGGTFAPEEPRIRDTFLEVLSETPQLDTILVNAPIGYPKADIRGYRACDIDAKEILGHRASSILPVPSRDVIDASDRFVEGLDIVTSAMLPRYREVAAEMSPFRQRTVYEGRPELSFMQLNGGVPLTHGKYTEAGVAERRALLLAKLNGVERILDAHLPRIRETNLLEVSVLVWSARRAFTHAARRIPTNPEWDPTGLRMEFIA